MASLIRAISSNIIYNNVLPNYKASVGILSGTMFLISLGFGSLIIYHSKIINK